MCSCCRHLYPPSKSHALSCAFYLSLASAALQPPLQLSHCHRLFDVEGVLHSLDSREAQEAALEKLAPLRPVLDEAAVTATAVRNCSAYRWVDLGALFGRIAA